MTDTIIKGSGNSRTLKTVPNLGALAPTYDKLLELITGDGLPVDLLGPNPEGCQVIGDSLGKAEFLADATETSIWGSAANRTPNQALQQLRSLIATAQSTADGKAKVEYGTAVKTSNGSKTFLFSFSPKAVLINASSQSAGSYALLLVYGSTEIVDPVFSKTVLISWGNNSVTISGDYFNRSTTYYYAAIG